MTTHTTLTWLFLTVLLANPLRAETAFARMQPYLDLSEALRFSVNDGAYDRAAWRAMLPVSAEELRLLLSVAGLKLSEDLHLHVAEALGRLGEGQVLASGQSTVALADGRYLSRSAMLLTPDADGWLWQSHGKPYALRSTLAQLPDSTVAVLRVGVNAPMLAPALFREMQAFGLPKQTVNALQRPLQQFPGAPALMAAAHEGILLAFCVDDARTWTLPDIGEIPAAGLLLRVPDPQAALHGLLLAGLQVLEPEALGQSTLSGVKVQTLEIPLPLLAGEAPVLQIAHHGGELLLSSEASLLSELLIRMETPAENSPLLRHLDERVPDEVVSAWVGLPALTPYLTQFLPELPTDGMMRIFYPQMLMSRVMMQGGFERLDGVAVLQVDGDVRQSVMLHPQARMQGLNQAQTTMLVPLVGGMGAAIALPGFQRARMQAQHNACINNLRQLDAAKDQWAIENGLQVGAIPTAADLRPYLRQFPVCARGGEYQINPVGQPPSCTCGIRLEW